MAESFRKPNPSAGSGEQGCQSDVKGPPLVVDMHTASWPRRFVLYAFPPLCLISSVLKRVRQELLKVIHISLSHHLVPGYSEITQPSSGAFQFLWGPLPQEARAIGIMTTLGQRQADCLYKFYRPCKSGIHHCCYDAKWQEIHQWCKEKNLDPLVCPFRYIKSLLHTIFFSIFIFLFILFTCHGGAITCHQ